MLFLTVLCINEQTGKVLSKSKRLSSKTTVLCFAWRRTPQLLGGAQKEGQNEVTITPTTFRLFPRIFHHGWKNSPRFGTQKHFTTDRILLYDLVVVLAFIKNTSILNDVHHPDTEAVHDFLHHIIRNSPGSKLVDSSLYVSSAYSYSLLERRLM